MTMKTMEMLNEKSDNASLLWDDDRVLLGIRRREQLSARTILSMSRNESRRKSEDEQCSGFSTASNSFSLSK